MGGAGGDGDTDGGKWLNGSPSFKGGYGGYGLVGGGGGYGGGGGSSEDAAGAGGGASYAMAATRTSSSAPTSCSGMDGNGVIHIAFDL